MEEWEPLLRGPLFAATFVFMLLGLARVGFLQLIDLGRAFRISHQSGHPLADDLQRFARRAWRTSPRLELPGWVIALSIAFYSLAFFIGLFLIDHAWRWMTGTGVVLPAVSKEVMDYCALVCLALGLTVLGARLFHGPSRQGSRMSDYLMLVCVLVIVATGIIAAHPAGLPLDYQRMMVCHLAAAEATFVILPFTRLAHELLHPLSQLGSRVFWSPGPAGAGVEVAHGVVRSWTDGGGEV